MLFSPCPPKKFFLLSHCVPPRGIPSSDPSHMAWYALNSAGGHAWPRVAQAGCGHTESLIKLRHFKDRLRQFNLRKATCRWSVRWQRMKATASATWKTELARKDGRYKLDDWEWITWKSIKSMVYHMTFSFSRRA